MLLGHVVLTTVETDGRQYSVAAALQGVEFERVLCLGERRVQHLGRCGGVTVLCHLHECTIRMRHGIPGIEGNRLLEHLEGLLIGISVSPRKWAMPRNKQS